MSAPLPSWVKVNPDGTINLDISITSDRPAPGVLDQVANFVRENPLAAVGGAALATWLLVRR